MKIDVFPHIMPRKFFDRMLEAALKEIDRAIDGLGATGVQMFSNVNRRPLDLPEFQPLFDRMAERRLPIWLHPARPAVADYVGESRSKFDLWWAFGWPYETSVAMGRLLFSGIFDRHRPRPHHP